MIRVSVLYSNTEGKKFDMVYYCNNHIPMVKGKLGAACKGITVDQGLGVRSLDRDRALPRWLICPSIQ